MAAPTVTATAVAGVVEITPVRHGDARGWFTETWNRSELAKFGITTEWVQDNESLSVPKGTLRGIHFQRPPHAQDKLVRVIAGSILDVAVDLRRSSPTFRQHVAVTLSAEVGNQLLIPKGFGHAFCTLEDNCRVAYKVSDIYDPDCDQSLLFCDEELAIAWPIQPEAAVVSEKDREAPTLADLHASDRLFD